MERATGQNGKKGEVPVLFCVELFFCFFVKMVDRYVNLVHFVMMLVGFIVVVVVVLKPFGVGFILVRPSKNIHTELR